MDKSSPRQRFLDCLNFKQPADSYPLIEWAAWWDQTYNRFLAEGLPQGMSFDESQTYFGLDVMNVLYVQGRGPKTPWNPTHGGGIITDEASYDAIRDTLYSQEALDSMINNAIALKERHDRGELVIRLWLDGFFWYPRTLFGIEEHLYAFYDQPELMHRMNADLTEYYIEAVERLLPILKPELVGFAEDMSYNLGPMLSEEMFDEFLLPYYLKLLPIFKENGVKVFIDSDGDITSMIPWFERAGIEGVYPLERQAGVDLVQIRKDYPKFLMMGGYDKMVMNQGEEAIENEFRRLEPVIKSGGYICSVDHQTPPGVSLEDYRIFIHHFKKYSKI